MYDTTPLLRGVGEGIAGIVRDLLIFFVFHGQKMFAAQFHV